MRYQGGFPGNDQPACTGVLLTNLGTPNAPSTSDVRRYLKEFLSDPRVVETPRLLWWLILNGFILRTRPARSAAAYQQVWTEQGSPLLFHSQAQAQGLQQLLDQEQTPVKVVLAMRYGTPGIDAGLEQLRRHNARRIVVLPLYPQYSATTSASTLDAVSSTLRRWRWVPELIFVNQYHQRPGYIRALADSVREFQERHGKPDRLLLSFHGIPQAYADAGDPYPEECRTTTELLSNELGLNSTECSLSFQSRVGPKEWLTPYTDETLRHWGATGVNHVQVVCPGFAADCLETLEEIGEENRDYFLTAGGKTFHYIPALNARPDHLRMLAALVREYAL